MSVSAIKSFFARQKEIRNRVYKEKVVEEVIEEPEEVRDMETLNEIFETFNTWNKYFPEDEQDLIYLYESLKEDEYEYLLSRKDELSLEVKKILWPEQHLPIIYLASNLKAKEMTDDMYNQIILQKAKQIQKQVEEYVSTMEIPPRSPGAVDERAEELKGDLIEYEKQLEDLKTSLSAPPVKGGRYVPPAMRKQMIENSPEVTRMENIIKNTKNEIQKLETKIIELDNVWKDTQRTTLKQQFAHEVELSMV